MIEILTTGLPNTVQDLGRTGHMALGIGHCGAMDRQALLVANLMLGNAPSEAGIEVALYPFRVRADVDTAVAVTGADCPATIGDRSCPPWWAMPIKAGEVLALDPPRTGARSYVAFAGGLAVPSVMGSRATDAKSGFGGIAGGGLMRGDRLPLGPAARVLPTDGIGAAVEERAEAALGNDVPIELRVLPGAEYEAFTDDARALFTATDWTVTADSNRVGCRLSGATLRLASPVELLSHGIVPGTLQVPRSGQPIIQLADANTCGGYPKIATVIEADLWRLAQAPVGAKLRFSLASAEAATEALRAQRRWRDTFVDTLDLIFGSRG